MSRGPSQQRRISSLGCCNEALPAPRTGEFPGGSQGSRPGSVPAPSWYRTLQTPRFKTTRLRGCLHHLHIWCSNVFNVFHTHCCFMLFHSSFAVQVTENYNALYEKMVGRTVRRLRKTPWGPHNFPAMEIDPGSGALLHRLRVALRTWTSVVAGRQEREWSISGGCKCIIYIYIYMSLNHDQSQVDTCIYIIFIIIVIFMITYIRDNR